MSCYRGTLATPRRAHERHGLPRGDGKVVALRDRLVRARGVGEVHVLEGDVAPHARGPQPRLREAVDRRDALRELQDIACGLARFREGRHRWLHQPQALRAQLQREHGYQQVPAVELALLPPGGRVGLQGVLRMVGGLRAVALEGEAAGVRERLSRLLQLARDLL